MAAPWDARDILERSAAAGLVLGGSGAWEFSSWMRVPSSTFNGFDVVASRPILLGEVIMREAPLLEVSDLNVRFRNGLNGQSSSLWSSGVLVHQLDTTEEKGRPWMPCSPNGADNWCRGLPDRWATSIINKEVPMQRL